ncbi:hypothetical protein ECE50_018845 [Chitinophaga sp. Mgbs1]|uniref:DUF5977 domain-containing protein n=1 Tax=Chitinophaga solisilvae TaxID=1233460 RepID=A0A9Q5DCB8_9BACT|nr:hypothetical protein [Chitinophaga solisilvae]
MYAMCIAMLPFTAHGQKVSVNMNPSQPNGQSRFFIPASPNAASLGIFGQIATTGFNGLPDINVPVYTIDYKELSVPVSLSYHAAGNKPDIFPGPVGMGWALNAGGAVTAIVRGLPDYERVASDDMLPYVSYPPTSSPTWSSAEDLKRGLKGYQAADDRGNPDEYQFNLNGVTGKIYRDHEGVYRISSKSDKFFKVEMEIAESRNIKMPPMPQNITPPRISGTYSDILLKTKMVYKITMTDAHGIKYIFGGNDDAIEFTRPGFEATTYPTDLTLASSVLPSTWNLTAIESPNGYRIRFEYVRRNYVTKTSFTYVAAYSWPVMVPIRYTPPPVVKGEKGLMMTGSFLSKIVSPKDSLLFYNSIADKQLQYVENPSLDNMAGGNLRYFDFYYDVHQSKTEGLCPLKLDSIILCYPDGAFNRSYNFSYTENLNTRLKLLGMTVKGAARVKGFDYRFEYDQRPLPPYLSNKLDHFGFYNGRSTYYPQSTNNGFPDADQEAMTRSKDPDTAFVQSEILKKITYPTGGYTVYEYEPNYYSSTVTTWPFGVAPNTPLVNKITGGVRIRSVASYDAPGHKANEKTFFYTKDYKNNGTLSSGVLAFQPSYFLRYEGEVKPPYRQASSTSTYRGNIVSWKMASNPIYPMAATRGNHINYSEVTEVNADGSFVVHTYKNHDNGYGDKPADNAVSDNTEIYEFWKEDEGNSMILERGQVLKEEYYNNAKAKKREVSYQYNDDPQRFEEHVRVWTQSPNSIADDNIPSYRVTASRIYTYFPYLKQTVSTAYENGVELNEITQFAYDVNNRNLISTKITSSENKQIESRTDYVSDANLSPVVREMYQRGMVGVSIGKSRLVNNNLTAVEATEYSRTLATKAGLYLPAYLKSSDGSIPAETRTVFNKYNDIGNVLSMNVSGGIQTCYVWSYNNLYIVAKIENASYSDVEAALGGAQAVASAAARIMTNSQLEAYLTPLRNSAALQQSAITTYQYDLLNGITMETDVNNLKKYYEYDNLGRLAVIRDHKRNIIKTVCYNYNGQTVECMFYVNTRQTGYFKSRSCEIGYVSGLIPYSIEANSIASTISVEDANQQALREIAARGQQYADSVGGCVFNDMGGSGLYGYASTPAGLCNVASQWWPVTSVTVGTSLTPGISGSRLYSGSGLQNLLGPGFFSSTTNKTIPTTYHYVEDGIVMYTTTCVAGAAYILRYRRSLPTGNAVCDTSGPRRAAFGNGPLAAGTTLYADHTRTTVVMDGYYFYDGKYFLVTDGVIGAVNNCDAYVSITRVKAGVGQQLADACAAPKVTDIYYNSTPFVGVGTVLYSNESLTVPLPAGYYAVDGGQVYVTGANGVITSLSGCAVSVTLSQGPTAAAACTTIRTIPVYFTGQLIDRFTLLFTDAAMTTPLAAGYYSDGVYGYRVSSLGAVTSKTPCQ